MELNHYGQESELSEQNKYEDTFDVFINFILKRSPTIFVLINMTLMIWLVQTIYSSNIDSIPRSIYFFAPFFQAQPFVNLYTSKSSSCKDGFSKLIIKTFPSVKEGFIKGTNLTGWDTDSIIFCVQTRNETPNFTKECNPNEISCSGFCVETITECPITTIKKIHSSEITPQGYESFYTTTDSLYKYVLTRENKNTYIVGLSAQFEARCSNDYKYFDQFDTFGAYWNTTKDCGDEGPLPTDIYRVFDEMGTETFLFNNGIWSPAIEEKTKNSQVFIGSINRIKFSNKTLECTQAEYLSRQVSNYLIEDPVKPTFTKSMLIIAFIFFTLSWAWLIGYYCFSGSSMDKNKLMILMLTIELIVVSFLYSQNIDMFKAEEIMVQIGNCVETDLQAASHWVFGITNSSPFKSIMFFCTVFLLLQAVALIIDKFMYQPYYSNQGQRAERDTFTCFWTR